MTTTKTARQGDYDSPWKEAIEVMLPDFMAFYFPDAWLAIDWQQPHRFLDQELQKIVPESYTGRRVVDKLVEVALVRGGDQWIHLHIEIQSSRASDFAERMMIYHYRIFGRFRLLYGQGWEKRRIIQLLRIIDWLMTLPPHLEQNLRQRLTAIEGERHMQYVTSFERLAREEGMQQGVQQGRLGLLIHLLTHRFGPLPNEITQRLEHATAEEIETWADRILDADSLAQVFGDRG